MRGLSITGSYGLSTPVFRVNAVVSTTMNGSGISPVNKILNSLLECEFHCSPPRILGRVQRLRFPKGLGLVRLASTRWLVVRLAPVLFGG